MGDRALIQIEDSDGNVGPVVYLHWDGNKVHKYISELKTLMAGRPDDLPYTTARLIGICHGDIEGNLSLGVWDGTTRLTEVDSHGDAGCFVVNCSDWTVDAFGGYGLTEEVTP